MEADARARAGRHALPRGSATRGAEIDAELARLDGVDQGARRFGAGRARDRVAELKAQEGVGVARRRDARRARGVGSPPSTRCSRRTPARSRRRRPSTTPASPTRGARRGAGRRRCGDQLHAEKPAVLDGAARGTFAAAKKAVDDAVAAGDWPAALAALPAQTAAVSQVAQAAAAKRRFDEAFAKIRANVTTARAVVAGEYAVAGHAGAGLRGRRPRRDARAGQPQLGLRPAPAADARDATKALLATCADGKDSTTR